MAENKTNFDLRKFIAENRQANVGEDYKPSLRAYNVIDGKGNIVYKELPRHTAIEKASEREDYGFIATDKLAEESIAKELGIDSQFSEETTVELTREEAFKKEIKDLLDS